MPRRPRRRLAAIVAADVAGYSRLIGRDEEGTLETLRGVRRDIVSPLLREHSGRIANTAGDSFLFEFASVVDAVRCALSMQRAMARRNAEVPDERRLEFRVGINVGDVVSEGADLLGDGVNVAARLEGLAEAGGIALSDDAYRQVRDRVDVAWGDAGEHALKNIARPVRVWCWSAQPTGATPRPVLPDKPSIVVLPFQNMSRDPEQEYFVDGMTEDIITDLSKASGLFVIARHSAFVYKGKTFNVADACRDLGVRFALEGSIRKAGNRVRISAQLIDGTSGGHLWAERYDRDLTDIFEVQDDVTQQIVGALKVHLTPDEQRRLDKRGTDSIEAYDWFLRGRELGWTHTREGLAEACPLLERASALDPHFALPLAYLAFVHVQEYVNRWSADPERSLQIAGELADRALQLDRAEPHTHFCLSIVHTWQKQVDRAIADARRALALDPNFADAYAALGVALHYAGRAGESLEQFERTTRLNPHYPPLMLFFMAQDHFALERYQEAAALLERRLVRQPESDITRVLLAACYGHLGRFEDARAAWREALRINPDYSIERRRQILPYKNPADFEHVVVGLRKAGLPV